MTSTQFPPRFKTIKGVSEVRRLPRVGIIRLGYREKNKRKSNKCECPPEETCPFCSHPVETDYFVCPEEVQAVYGDKPKELDIYLPVNDQEDFFPQAYIWYRSGGKITCQGNGEEAYRDDEGKGDYTKRTCTCEKLDEGMCKKRATLYIILPKVRMGGVYQISSGSWNTMVDVQSGIDFARVLVDPVEHRRIAMVPLKLIREKRETQYRDPKNFNMVVSTHYPLKVMLDMDLRALLSKGKIELPPAEFEGEEEGGEPDDPGFIKGAAKLARVSDADIAKLARAEVSTEKKPDARGVDLNTEINIDKLATALSEPQEKLGGASIMERAKGMGWTEEMLKATINAINTEVNAETPQSQATAVTLTDEERKELDVVVEEEAKAEEDALEKERIRADEETKALAAAATTKPDKKPTKTQAPSEPCILQSQVNVLQGRLKNSKISIETFLRAMTSSEMTSLKSIEFLPSSQMNYALQWIREQVKQRKKEPADGKLV